MRESNREMSRVSLLTRRRRLVSTWVSWES